MFPDKTFWGFLFSQQIQMSHGMWIYIYISFNILDDL